MENKEYWIFTFGSGQLHAGHYVKIAGTFDEARSKMFERYGDDWAFQYSEDEWAYWLEHKPAWVPAETEIEVIE